MIQRLEFHYTPKHGSWLNIACPGGGPEIEFRSSATNAGEPPEDERRSNGRIAALETERNQAAAPSTGDSPPPMPGTSSAYLSMVSHWY